MNPSTQTLGELVTETPAAARVLHRHGLDYCCGGRQTLAEACTAAALDPDALLAEIAAAHRPRTDPQVRWDERPLPELVDHILTRYHETLREDLPRLVDLARRVEQVHADREGCPLGLANLLQHVWDSVRSHLLKEEQIVFPLIVAGKGRWAHGPVSAMLREHDDHGENLRRIRRLTRDRVAPPAACDSWRELYRALEQLEVELMDHIHLENNILFVRALNT